PRHTRPSPPRGSAVLGQAAALDVAGSVECLDPAERVVLVAIERAAAAAGPEHGHRFARRSRQLHEAQLAVFDEAARHAGLAAVRSEEHTSELQSRENL